MMGAAVSGRTPDNRNDQAMSSPTGEKLADSPKPTGEVFVVYEKNFNLLIILCFIFLLTGGI